MATTAIQQRIRIHQSNRLTTHRRVRQLRPSLDTVKLADFLCNDWFYHEEHIGEMSDEKFAEIEAQRQKNGGACDECRAFAEVLFFQFSEVA